jgi:hypothetical protein
MVLIPLMENILSKDIKKHKIKLTSLWASSPYQKKSTAFPIKYEEKNN